MGRGVKWDVKDDLALIKAWANVTSCRENNNVLKGDKLWDMIRAEYEANVFTVKRNSEGIRGRFKKVNRDIKRFHSIYISCNNCMQDALKSYRETSSKKKFFQYIECWEFLKDLPNWKDLEEIDLERRDLQLSSNRFHDDYISDNEHEESSLCFPEKTFKRRKLSSGTSDNNSSLQLEMLRQVHEGLLGNTKLLEETKDILISIRDLHKKQLEKDYICLLSVDDPIRIAYIETMKQKQFLDTRIYHSS